MINNTIIKLIIMIILVMIMLLDFHAVTSPTVNEELQGVQSYDMRERF